MLLEIYTWDSVRAYHFDFHQARILEGIDDSLAWKTPDHQLKQYLLVARPTRNATSQNNRDAHTGGNSSTPSTEVCFKWNFEKDCPSNCRFLHQCTNCTCNHTKRRCPSQSVTSGPNNANSTPVGQRQQQTEYALEFISESFPYPVTNPTDPPLYKPGPLLVEGWKFCLKKYPDIIYQETILSIIIRGAKIGYCGPKQKIISSNLPSATNDTNTLTADLENQILADQLTKVSDIGNRFISSPLGLAPKSNGKWRRIHHLSYPRGRSVNCHIPKEWGALEYTTFDEAKQEVIQAGLGSIMVKCDLKDAFRHIPVSP